MALADTLDTMAQQVGKNIKYYNDTDGWKTTRDITEADIKQHLNWLYRDDMFPEFVTQYPHSFREKGLLNSWIASGTAAAGLTDSTLTATTEIFTSSMANLQLYVVNTTDDSSTYITGYTSTTEVTVNDDDISDWSGDAIYIIGQEFTFGGDAANLWDIESVGVKYNSTDTSYRKATPMDKDDIFQDGGETGSEASPVWYPTSVVVSSAQNAAVGIYPKLQNKFSEAIEIEYSGKVSDLTDDVAPTLPVSVPLIYGATAWAFRQKQDHESADVWEAKYEMAKKRAISRWRPKSKDGPRRIRVPRHYAAIYNRDR